MDDEPLSGPQVRLDVYTRDPEHATQVVDALSRMALSVGLDGAVAAVLVIPRGLTVDVDTEIAYDPEETP